MKLKKGICALLISSLFITLLMPFNVLAEEEVDPYALVTASSSVAEEDAEAPEAEFTEEGTQTVTQSVEKTEKAELKEETGAGETAAKEEETITRAAATMSLYAELSEDEKTVLITLNNISDPSRTYRVALWSDTGGQDDLKWFDLEPSGDTAQSAHANISISDFKHTGLFHCHCYGYSGGESAYAAAAVFTTAPVTVSGITVGEPDPTNGAMEITLNDLYAPSGIGKVSVAVWGKSDQSDLKWYESENGTVTAQLSEQGFCSGNYTIHAYVTDGNGIRAFAAGTKKEITVPAALTYEKKDGGIVRVYAAGIGPDVKELRFGAWSSEGGQDDLKWYTLKRDGKKSYIDIPLKNHKSFGEYLVHCYASEGGVNTHYISGCRFVVDRPSSGGLTMEMSDAGNGDFMLELHDLACDTGVSRISFAVWSSPDQSDIKWYNITPGAGQEVYLTGNIKDHAGMLGKYTAHAYLTDTCGNRVFIGGTACTVSVAYEGLESEEDPDGHLTVRITGVKDYGCLSSLKFALYRVENGAQKEIHWYTARKSGSTYSAVIDEGDYEVGGRYCIHVYGYDRAGKSVFIMGSVVTLFGSASLEGIKKAVFPVEFTAIPDDGSVTSVIVEARYAGDQEKTIISEEASGGPVTVNVPISSFSYREGDYEFEAFVMKADGTKKPVGTMSSTVTVSRGAIKTEALTETGFNRKLTISGVSFFGLEDQAKAAVWSSQDGQDDLKWYPLKNDGKGNLSVIIPISNHPGTGTYHVHVYCSAPEGNSLYLTGTSFNYEGTGKGKMTVSGIKPSEGRYHVNVELGQLEGSGTKTISAVKVCAWEAKEDGESIHQYWYEMQPDANNLYQADVYAKNHDFDFGEYINHVYVYYTDGTAEFACGTRTVLEPANYFYVDSDETVCTIKVFGATLNGSNVVRVVFPTWSNLNGQDDIKWYSAGKNADGSFTINIKREDFAVSGTYTTHIYFQTMTESKCVKVMSYQLGGLDAHATEVMRKILYAVETGGQRYGYQRYNDFTPAYKNTAGEHAITIGAGCWYAGEARKLVVLIQQADPASFAALDTAGIAADLQRYPSWSTYGTDGGIYSTIEEGRRHRTIDVGSAKAVCLQNIISSPVGIAVQDSLVNEQAKQYAKEANAQGVYDIKAVMFCVNLRHLGGYSGMSRIIRNCKNDGLELTMENLWATMLAHDNQSPGATQVGSPIFHSRHIKVMEWINKYM